MSYARNIRRLAERGHTLAELIIVVAVIAIVAAVALPALDDNDEETLDYVVAEAAAAFRFARAEAMRTGLPHGVHVDMSSAPRLRVYWLDTAGGGLTVNYDVLNPLTKSLYELRFDGQSMPDGAHIVDHEFYFGGSSTNNDYMGFNPDGTPKSAGGSSGSSGSGGWDWCWWCSGGGGGSTGVDLLDSAVLRLGYRGLQREVHIEPTTGRVSVQ